jgi:hypothetical protein
VTREAGHRSNTGRARLARTLCTLLNKEEEQAPNIRPAGRHRPSQREVTRADIPEPRRVEHAPRARRVSLLLLPPPSCTPNSGTSHGRR